MWRRKIGPLEVNFRVILEPKGLLRIIILVLSILAFALTAGYSSSDNTEECRDNNNNRIVARLEFGYTFHSETFDIKYTDIPPNSNRTSNGTNGSSVEFTCQTDFDTNYDGGAEFFVAMGVLSMLYSMGVIPIYMVFLNDQWSYSKWIANIDFIASVIFSFMYLIADIVWSVQTAALKNYVDDQLESSSSCLQSFAVCETEPISSTDSYLQLDISLVFGWLTMATWVAILWFLFKDTTFFNDPKAPWANYKKRKMEAASVQQNPVQGEAGNQNVAVPHPTVETKSDEQADP